MSPDRRPVRSLRQRMTPTAILVGVLISLMPPIAGWVLERERARLWAEDTAERVAIAATSMASRQPVLWRYDVHKILDVVDIDPEVDASVRVVDCSRSTVFGQPMLHEGSGRALRATAPVRTGDGVIAFVEVDRFSRAPRQAAAVLAAFSFPVGLGVAVFLLFYPIRVLRQQVEAAASVRRSGVSAVRAQEQERTRIARELHDSLGQHLTAVRLEVTRLERDGELSETEGAALRTLNDAMLEDLRRVVSDLRPIELDGRTLREAIADYTEVYEHRTGIAVAFSDDGTVASDPLASTIIRLVQEALNNVARHAEASEVGVALQLDGDDLMLVIEDDGRGFDVEAVRRQGGLREHAGAHRSRRWRLAGRIVGFRHSAHGSDSPHMNASPTIRVALVDDHRILREGVRVLLESEADIEVVAEGKRAADVATLVAAHTPDVLVLDLGLPDGSGVEAATTVLSEAGAPRILALTMYDDSATVAAALRSGIHGFVVKGAGVDALAEAIRTVYRGQLYVTPDVAEHVVDGFRKRSRSIGELTARETEVLRLVAEGLTSRQIAERIDIAVKTVRNHRTNIMDKLGIRTTAGLVRYALRTGLA